MAAVHSAVNARRRLRPAAERSGHRSSKRWSPVWVAKIGASANRPSRKASTRVEKSLTGTSAWVMRRVYGRAGDADGSPPLATIATVTAATQLAQPIALEGRIVRLEPLELEHVPRLA